MMPGGLQPETVFVPSILLFDYIFYFLPSDWIGHMLTRGLYLHIIEVLVDRSLKFEPCKKHVFHPNGPEMN